MHSIDFDVLKSCEEWLSQGHQCELVTVIKTWGSSPRPVGAMLAIRDDGCVVGSVSGGCIEDDLIEQVRRNGLTRTRPEIVTYGITADDRIASACLAGEPSGWRLNRCRPKAAFRNYCNA